jgi:hypothetical protein
MWGGLPHLLFSKKSGETRSIRKILLMFQKAYHSLKRKFPIYIGKLSTLRGNPSKSRTRIFPEIQDKILFGGKLISTPKKN